VPDGSDDEEGDRISDSSNRGCPYGDLGDPSDDVAAALIRLRDTFHIEDEAVRAVSLNIATGPVIINRPMEKRKHLVCPKHSRGAMVYEIAECRKCVREAFVVIEELPAKHRMAHWGLVEELYDQFDDNVGLTPLNSISMREIKMLIELGGFITCDPREDEDVKGVPVPLGTCGEIELQETIEVMITGDSAGPRQHVSYGELSSNNCKKQCDLDG
jgi:hypothetical protein